MKRTRNYITTLNHKSLIGIERLAAIRDGVNAVNRISEKKHYVKCQGRLGPNNPNAPKYQNRGWNSHSCIRLEDAAYVDVYIYERYQ